MRVHWNFLHGWGMRPMCWQPVLSYLPTHATMDCLTLPGHEQDPHSANWDETLARYADITVPGIWVGWSLGGLVAIEFAKRYPEKVERLILIATNPHWLAKDDWPGVSQSDWRSFKSTAQEDLMKALKQLLILQGYTVKNRYDLAALITCADTNFTEPLLKTLDWLADIDLRGTLCDLTMPVLHVFGGLDRLVPINVAEAIHACAPNHKVVILQDANHDPMQSHSQILAQQMLSWSEL